MSVTDDYLANNRAYAATLTGRLPLPPSKHVAVVRGTADVVGIKPPWSAEAFSDLDADVRQSINRITGSPYIPHTDKVRGFVFDVATGLLNEVDAAGGSGGQ